MAEAIFFDVLPKFGFAAMEAGLAKFKSSSAEAGKIAGDSLSGGTDTALKKVQDAYMSASNSAVDMAAKASRANADVEASQRKVVTSSGQVEVAIKRLSETYDTYGAGTSQVIAAENRVVDAWARTDAAAKVHSDAIAASEAAVLRSTDAAAAQVAAHDKMTAAQNGAAASTLALGRTLNTAGAAAFAGFGATVYETTKTAADFQTGLMKLKASADETGSVTAGNLKAVSDGVLQLAGQVGYSPGNLMDAMYGVEKAGYRGADGIAVLKAAAQLASIEGADLHNTVDGLTTSLNDFGMNQDQAANIASKLKVAVGMTKGTIDDFTGSLHNVEPAARTFMGTSQAALEQTYTALARMSQSGETLDQSSQNVRNTIEHLGSMTLGPQRDALSALGLNPDQLAKQFQNAAAPGGGLIGVLDTLQQTIQSKLTPNQQVVMSDMFQSSQATETQTKMLTNMSPAAASAAAALQNHTMSLKDYNATIKGSNIEDATQLKQFETLQAKIDGFSNNLKRNQSDVETVGRVWRDTTGTDAGLTVAAQLVGTPELAKETADGLQKVHQAAADANHDVAGLADTQETLNNKLARAKAAFGAAAIELGTTFVPAMTHVANGLKDVGDFLQKHETLARNAAYGVGLLGGAWVITKAALAVGNTFSAIGDGIDLVIRKFGLIGPAAKAAASEVNVAAEAEIGAQGRVGVAAEGAATKVASVGRAALNAAALVGGLAYATTQASDAFNQWSNDHPDVQRRDQNGRIIRGRESQGGAPFDGAVQVGTLPVASPDQYARPGAQAERQGGRVHDYGLAPADTGPIQAAADAAVPTPDVPTPGSGLTPEQLAAQAKAAKAPAGDKNDPIYIAHDSGAASGKDSEVYNPFAQFQTGGFTPASLVGFATTFALNEALGNPYGKQVAAQKRGESPDSPLYVSSVDVDKAQSDLNDAIRKYGPDSTQAQDASARLRGTQAAVGTVGGYFDPVTGAISAHDPSKYLDSSTGRYVTNPNYGSGGFQGSSGAVTPGAGAEGWRSTVAETVAKYGAAAGIPQSQYGNWTDAIVRQIQTESGGNPNADNPNDSNGRGGRQHVAGLLQYLPSTFANSAQQLTGITNMMDPTAQIAGALLAGHNAAGGPTDIGNGVGWGPSRQPLYQVPPSAPAVVPTSSGSGTGVPLGAPTSLTDLRSLFTGGGGEGPIFKRSPASTGGPLPIPGAGIFTDGTHGATDPNYNLRPDGSRSGAVPTPRTSGLSPFAPGGALSAPSPNDFGGIGLPGRPGGAAAPQIGPFPVPGAVNAARIPGSNLATAGIQGAQRAATPPGNANLQTPGGGAPARMGTGKGGGTSLGSTAAAIAGPALDALAPGASIAAQKGGQLLDRAIGYVGQLAGIGISGLFETFGLNDSPLADPGKSVFGRLAGGLAGAHKTAENVAGQTTPPLKPPDPPDGSPASGNGSGPKPGPGGVGGAAGAPLIGTMNVNHTGDPNGQRIATDIDRHLSSAGVGQTRG